MTQQLRSIGFGLLTAMVVISVIEALGHAIYPVGNNIDYNDPQQTRMLFATMPFGALAFIVNAWIVASFAGGIVATRMFPEKGLFNALMVGLLVLGFTVLNMSLLPHPTWMWVTAFVGIVPGAWLGNFIASKKK